jgi:hypothetical protein
MRGQRVSAESRKVDVVVVSARYTSEGHVHQVQAYRRLGPVWSDLVLLSREELLNHLRAGARIVTGGPLGIPGDFRIDASVRCQRVNGSERLVIQGRKTEDETLGVPLF